MNWLREQHRGEELGSKTVGIIGYGVMGSSFSEKLKGIGCKVIAYDKYKSGFSSDLVEEVTEEEFFSRSEVVSVHVPWTSETKRNGGQSMVKPIYSSHYIHQYFSWRCSKTADLLTL